MSILDSKKSIFVVLAAGVLSLTACGGGKKSSSSDKAEVDPPPVVLPTTTFSGVFDGQIAGTGQPITSLLQADGSYYLVYSNASGAQIPAGAVMGTGALAGEDFTSSNGQDASLTGSGTQAATLTSVAATFKQDVSFNGTLTSGSRANQSFSGAFNSAYKQLPAIANLAGVYTGAIATKDVKEDNLQLTISSDGSISGKLSCGCNITATLAPRSDGTSYAAGLSFKGGEHPLSNKSMGGNVYFDAARKRLYIVGKLSGTSDSAIFVGTRP